MSAVVFQTPNGKIRVDLAAGLAGHNGDPEGGYSMRPIGTEPADWLAFNSRAMLIVGAQNYLRERVPFAVLQEFDVFLLFKPQAEHSWLVGAVALSRVNQGAEPVRVAVRDTDTRAALSRLFVELTAAVAPRLGSERAEPSAVERTRALWWTHWIYRQEKITLADTLALDAYANAERNAE